MSGIVDRRARARAATGSDDATRTARLIFDAELAAGAVSADDVLTEGVLRALRPASPPGSPRRILQAALKNRHGGWAATQAAAAHVAVRRRVLGDAAQAAPRFLVRVDEFPHYQAWDAPDRFGTDAFLRFHEIMHRCGVPYLVAALPRVSRRPLDPAGHEWRPVTSQEREVLQRLASADVAIALHGRDHRTRATSPRHHSELCGLDDRRTAALLNEGMSELQAAVGSPPEVFVAPYNRFDARQWPALAARFQVVGGGPESIRLIGLRPSPQWWRGAVYLPAYAPFYGRAAEVLPAVRNCIQAGLGLWTPVVLHWGWEAETGWRDLEQLAAELAPYAAPWSEFLAAVHRSR